MIGHQLSLAAIAISTLVLPATALAQSTGSPAEANAAYQAKGWSAAAQAYEALAAREPENGMAWFRASTSQLQLRAFDRAIVAFEKADGLGFAPFFTKYNLACSYAGLMRLDDAFRALNGAIDSGCKNVENLRS